MDFAQVDTLLGVWAHPDDEAYLSSGLMARAVDAGVRVVCLTATRGEGGSLDPERWPPQTLGSVRESELLRSLAHLGVTEHRFLGLPDVDWHTPLPSEGAALVEQAVAEVKPDVVLTFGPDGVTGHEGHKSVSRWTTDAMAQVEGDEPQLYYAVYARSWAEEFLPLIEPHGVFMDGAEPPVVADEAVDVLVYLDDHEISRKMTALKEHQSQLFGLIEVFGEDTLTEAMRSESFCLAGSTTR